MDVFDNPKSARARGMPTAVSPANTEFASTAMRIGTLAGLDDWSRLATAVGEESFMCSYLRSDKEESLGAILGPSATYRQVSRGAEAATRLAAPRGQAEAADGL